MQVVETALPLLAGPLVVAGLRAVGPSPTIQLYLCVTHYHIVFFYLLFLFYLKIRPRSPGQEENPRRRRHIDLAEWSEDSGASSIFGFT